MLRVLIRSAFGLQGASLLMSTTNICFQVKFEKNISTFGSTFIRLFYHFFTYTGHKSRMTQTDSF